MELRDRLRSRGEDVSVKRYSYPKDPDFLTDYEGYVSDNTVDMDEGLDISESSNLKRPASCSPGNRKLSEIRSVGDGWTPSTPSDSAPAVAV